MTHRPYLERAAHVLAAVALACGLLAAAPLVKTFATGSAAGHRPARLTLTRAAEGDVVARITAPRLGIDAAVLEGVGSATLALGPGHLPSTPLPGDEEGANDSIIAIPRDVGCAAIASLRVGDRVRMRTPFGIKSYRVSRRRIAAAGEIGMDPRKRPHVILLTAYPPDAIGPAPMRLAITLEPTGDHGGSPAGEGAP